MCKVTRYSYTECNHAHLRQEPCRGTKRIGYKARAVALCKVNEQDRPTLTINVESACPPCAKERIKMGHAAKCLEVVDRYEASAAYFTYAQVKIDDALATYDRHARRLDRLVPLQKSIGMYDNTFLGRPISQSKVRTGSRLRKEIKLEEDPEVLAAGKALFLSSFAAVEEEEEEEEERPKKRVQLSPAIRPRAESVETPPRPKLMLKLGNPNKAGTSSAAKEEDAGKRWSKRSGREIKLSRKARENDEK